MADIVTSEVRSRMMAGIKGKDTAPEIAIRKDLHRRGFRYRLHDHQGAGTESGDRQAVAPADAISEESTP